ncbi:MAG: c-type cytochrome [Myxococcales bacterium]|nr:c-type cytochrome [Myxococcales bacterium]
MALSRSPAARLPRAPFHSWLLASLVAACGSGADPAVHAAGQAPTDEGEAGAPDAATPMSLEALGEALFFDRNLSRHRTQACSTCHDPERAFIDPRTNDSGLISAVSRGDDGVSLGDRNAPTVTYAALTIPIALGVDTRARHNKQSKHRTYEGPLGGLFLDGRAEGLAGQALGPPLNPLEMGMPDEAAVVARVEDNTAYVAALVAHFGDDVFDEPETAYGAIGEAIAAFERTERFAPFDSKYDRSLVGDATLSFKELTGKSVFFSEFANCAICHQLHQNGDPVRKLRETFTGYEYHNIGVPENRAVRAQNGVTEPDLGLANNAGFNDPEHRGKFKVPTLRNVAVTEPYMHNGVFRDLRTAVLFYEHFVDPEAHPVNPETDRPWLEPEFPETVSTELLQVGNGLTEAEVDALVCFLRTLTDRRYEHLIADKGITCED